jgi:hypothetical protein
MGQGPLVPTALLREKNKIKIKLKIKKKRYTSKPKTIS